MKLTALIDAEIYRDGGSYEARFQTDDGEPYTVWLQAFAARTQSRPRHQWLFEYRADQRPADAVPVVSGSQQEHELLARLDAFLLAPTETPVATAWPPEGHRLARLREMREFIPQREPCLPSDLRRAGFTR